MITRYQFQMSEQEEFSKPRNLAASLFRDDLGDFELPQNSNIHKWQKQEAPAANIRQSKYQENTDDDFLDINLGFQSHIAPKITDNSNSSTNSARSQSNQKKTEPKITTKYAQSKIQRRPKKPEPVKKEVDIDGEIGEIAQWAQRGAKNNSDEEDFDDNNEPDKVGETNEQIQIRRKLEQKLKAGFNNDKKQVGGLKAKAQQLRKQNEIKAKLQQIKEQSMEMSKTTNDVKNSIKLKQSLEQQKQKNVEQVHNQSSMHLVQEKKPTKPAQRHEQQDEDDIDDHWNKINTHTVNQMTAIQEKRKQMTLKSVLYYYEKQFKFDEAEIDDEAIGVDYHAQEEENEEVGCLAAICACFKQDKRSTKHNFNASIAKRLVAISKKHLSNGDEQFFILKEIWTRLTTKQFSRYGGHWNQIGFQGRDPATDLRSTGVLSLLQWVQFIESHPKLSQKYNSWSIQHEYPLALTFIKLTGVFLDLLARGDIMADSWSGFQDCFNSLVWGMFGKMMEKYKIGDTLGNFVEEQAKQIKKQYKKLYASYQQQFKKPK